MSDSGSIPAWVTAPMPVAVQEGTPVPEEYNNDFGIRYDTRTGSSIELKFDSIEADTDKAILINITNTSTGEMLVEWFPKKLMTNLNESNCTIRCWSVFAEDKKAHLFSDDTGSGDAE